MVDNAKLLAMLRLELRAKDPDFDTLEKHSNRAHESTSKADKFTKSMKDRHTY